MNIVLHNEFYYVSPSSNNHELNNEYVSRIEDFHLILEIQANNQRRKKHERW